MESSTHSKQRPREHNAVTEREELTTVPAEGRIYGFDCHQVKSAVHSGVDNGRSHRHARL